MTSVKETEELAYLFIAVGIRIALGADQIVPTSLATTIILIFATLRTFVWRKAPKQNLSLNIELRDVATDREKMLQVIVGAITPTVSEVDLRWFDTSPELGQATFYIVCKDDEAVVDTIAALQRELPGIANITFIDQSIAWKHRLQRPDENRSQALNRARRDITRTDSSNPYRPTQRRTQIYPKRSIVEPFTSRQLRRRHPNRWRSLQGFRLWRRRCDDWNSIGPGRRGPRRWQQFGNGESSPATTSWHSGEGWS